MLLHRHVTEALEDIVVDIIPDNSSSSRPAFPDETPDYWQIFTTGKHRDLVATLYNESSGRVIKHRDTKRRMQDYAILHDAIRLYFSDFRLALIAKLHGLYGNNILFEEQAIEV